MKAGYLALCLAATLVAAAPAAAQGGQGEESSIIIERAWARPMPGGSETGAGYLTIRNAGEVADRLVSAVTPRAERAEFHETSIVDDVMRMRPVAGGVEIAPGETVEMRPGGLHIMFLEVAEPLVAGETVPGRLDFERAGERDILFKVESRPAAAPHGADDGHDTHDSHGGHAH